MIRRIVLENFMAHAHTVIELAEGLTVLTGPNNCGKSAIVTALQTVCGNERGSFMIRHGSDECRVTIETDDDHVVQWERTKKGVRYVIDGRAVDRLRGSIPDDLHDHLRLPTIEAADGSGEFDIHFGEQKRPIFLLDQNGRQSAAFFASSSDAALLVEMQALHKKRVQERRQDQKTLSQEVSRCNRMLESLDRIELMTDEVAGLQERYEAVSRRQEVVLQLDDLTRELGVRLEIESQLDTRHRTLEPLDQPASLLPDVDLAEVADELALAHSTCNVDSARQEVLQSLSSPPAIESTDKLSRLVESVSRLQLSQQQLEQGRSVLAGLDAPPASEDDETLQTLTRQLHSHQRDRHRQASRHEILSRLEELPEVQPTGSLEATIKELELLQDRHSQLQVTLSGLEADRLQVVESLFAWANANPSCPVCGGPVSGDHLLEHQGVGEHGRD